MGNITGGELLVRCLANEGIKLVFGLPCPEIDPVLAKLEEYDIRFVPVRHEAAAVYMAEGVYKTTGRVAVVHGNPGPGSANLLPGVITARHEGVPVIVITSQHRHANVYPASPAIFQGQDQLDIFKPAVKWGAPIFSWDRIPEIVRLAFREIWNGRPGPVQLEIPMPVMYAEGDENTVPVIPPAQYRAPLPQPSETQLQEAADLLSKAERPLIFSGSGVDRGGANDALIELAELLNCPVMTTMAGRSTVSADHPNYIYSFGYGGDVIRQEADVVLVAGSRLGNLDTPYDKYWGDPAKHKIIQIDIDPRNIGVTRPLTLGIVGDVKATLEGLLRVLKTKNVRPQDGKDLARYRQTDQAWRNEQFQIVRDWPGPGIHPAHAAQTIGSFFGKDAIYTVDGGNTQLWSYWFLPPTGPRSYLGTQELGMLGSGIPAALGAKLANPGREVVCVTGDGAVGFNFMEMQSAARENLKFTTIVFAEGAWTMEEPNELMLYGKTFGTKQGTIRWDKAAEGLGCHGEYVEKLEDLEPALKRAREHNGPTVICVKTDHGANLNFPQLLFGRFVEVYHGPN
ncbi:MAG: thiamine pyrophosphate-binding protein [Peptococcaceae bacterium]|nr:thiamine pyrophosphate-binding protein [Peptococcaceae bacterium]